MGLFLDRQKHINYIFSRHSDEILYMWRYDGTLQEIADKYSISRDTVKKFLVRKCLYPRVTHDLPFDTSPFRDRTTMILDSEQGKIRELYKAGSTLESIAARVGLSVYLIRKFLILIGVFVPRRQTAPKKKNPETTPKQTTTAQTKRIVSAADIEYNFACRVCDLLNDGRGLQWVARELRVSVDEVCRIIRLHLKTRGSRWCV